MAQLPAPRCRADGLRRARVFASHETTDLRERLARDHTNVDNAFRGWNDVWLHPDFREWNIEEYLPNITVPMLLMQGSDDEYGTWKQIDAIERSTGARARAHGGIRQSAGVNQCLTERLRGAS